MCCSPWGHKESDMTEWLNNKNLMLERMKLLDVIINSMNMSLSKLEEITEEKESWCATFHGVTKSQT